MSRLNVQLKDEQPFHSERIKTDPRQDLLERQAREQRAARRRAIQIRWFLAATAVLFCAVVYFR